MSRKFIRKFKEARTFIEWMECLKRFNYSLIKENGLQLWTMQDYKNYWMQYKGAL